MMRLCSVHGRAGTTLVSTKREHEQKRLDFVQQAAWGCGRAVCSAQHLGAPRRRGRDCGPDLEVLRLGGWTSSPGPRCCLRVGLCFPAWGESVWIEVLGIVGTDS